MIYLIYLESVNIPYEIIVYSLDQEMCCKRGVLSKGQDKEFVADVG